MGLLLDIGTNDVQRKGTPMIIPEVRDAFLLHADELDAEADIEMAEAQALVQILMDKATDKAMAKRRRATFVREMVTQLYRRKPFRRAPATARRMSPAVAAHIRQLLRDNPTMSQQEVSEKAGVKAGRVSETLRGKRRRGPARIVKGTDPFRPGHSTQHRVMH